MDKERKNLMVFGYGLAVILTVWALLLWRKHPAIQWPWALLVLAVGFAAVTFRNIEYLKPVYKHWMRAAHAIGQVITTVLLSVIFYLVFAPVGIILRMLRKDLLDRSLESSAVTYWKKKEEAPEKERYTKQF